MTHTLLNHTNVWFYIKIYSKQPCHCIQKSLNLIQQALLLYTAIYRQGLNVYYHFKYSSLEQNNYSQQDNKNLNKQLLVNNNK